MSNPDNQHIVQECPPKTTPTPTLLTTTKPAPTTIYLPTKPSTTSSKPPTTSKHSNPPIPVNPVCGGGRSNYKTCDEGWTCIKDPTKSGCGPECDGYGICVKEKMCGGFAGFSCDDPRAVCIDDPRDSCDPLKGGADCGGLCMFKE